MRKNDLIKKLQALKGNPEVVLWNGMVGDWMAIGSLQESYLTKITKQYWLTACETEDKILRRDFDYKMPDNEKAELSKRYSKEFAWECNEHVTSEDVDAGRYKTKRVVYINAKKRGVSTLDRLGSISY